jgi:hypothetical protein
MVLLLPSILLLPLDLFCHLMLITCYHGSLPWCLYEVSLPRFMALCWANAGSVLQLSLLSGCSHQPDLKVCMCSGAEQHIALYPLHTSFHKPIH